MVTTIRPVSGQGASTALVCAALLLLGFAPPQDAAKGGQEPAFAADAFPPPLPDTKNHRRSWWILDCMRCHDTGVADAPRLVHATVPEIAAVAKCRTCHVMIAGLKPRPRKAAPGEDRFLANAFPPMIPSSDSHQRAWLDDSCLLCHENGVKGAPLVQHEGMPKLLLGAKCRSCHVQVRNPRLTGR